MPSTQDASRVPMAETKRPWWYVTDQEPLKKLIEDHSKVLVKIEVAVTGLQRRLSMVQTRCDSLEMSCQGVAEQNENLTDTQQQLVIGHSGLKGGLEAVTDRVVSIASGVDAVAGCVLELEGRLQQFRLDNVSENLSTSSWMKEFGHKCKELSELHASYNIDILSGKLCDAKFEKTLTPSQPSVATSFGECNYSDSPESSASSESHDAVTEPATEEQQSASTMARHGADHQTTQLGLGTGETKKPHRACEKAGQKLGRPMIRVMPPLTGAATSRATEQRPQDHEEYQAHLPGVRAPPRLGGSASLRPPLAPSCAVLRDAY